MADLNTSVTPEGAPIAPEVQPEVVVENPEMDVELEAVPEVATEQVIETAPEQAATTGGSSAPVAEPVAVVAPIEAIPVPEKTEEQKAVEGILSEGLEDLYSNLPDNRKAEFKVKGEETATKINILLQGVKVQVGKVVDLIKTWLSMIPGVNKFFLEQESKIKADKLLEYKDEKEGKI